MSNDFDKYLAIANHDIQMANNDGQLKSYVASILYDYDKNVEQLLLDKCKAELELVRLNNKHNKALEKIDKALEKINDYKIYCENNKGFTEYTDIEIEAIEPVISKLEDILKEEK